MIYEAIFNGNTIQTLENIDIPQNYRLFVEVPEKQLSDKEAKEIKNKLDALNSVFGLLTENEANEYDKAISKKVNFTERV